MPKLAVDRHAIVPDYTPVTAEQLRGHLETCPDCSGCLAGWCEAGKDLFAKFADQGQRERERHDKRQAWELIDAGWKFEVIGPDSAVMSWYWRAVPKRRGRPGRLYRSTNQAWRAMVRARGGDPDNGSERRGQ